MLKRWKKNWTGGAVAPYSQLAEIYDYVMRHVDYVHWADYIEAIFNRFEYKPSTILELACGTGNMAAVLAARGYHMTGVDLSEAMVHVARRKNQVQDQKILFIQGDMQNPPIDDTFDAILCLYDSTNYLMELDSVREMLEHVRNCLASDGLFIFDACTEMNSRRYFNRETEHEGTKDFAYVRRSEYLEAERIQVNEFQLVIKDGDESHQYFERHQQRIYPFSEILEVCRTSDFKILGTFDGFSFTPATEDSNRIHFVLRAS